MTSSLSGVQQQTEVDSGGSPFSTSRAPFRTSLSAAGGARHGNMMYDPRVIRGSTHCAMRPLPSRRISKDRRRRGRQPSVRRKLDDVPTPHGREHSSVQTEQYLTEIHVDPRALDKSIAVQTDPLMDRPSPPLFIPRPSGPSVATQIEEGDLFDFDTEVQPILETLLGKTLTAAVEQVLDESELAQWQLHRTQFEAKRTAVIAECQAAEEKERQREAQRRARIAQEVARAEADRLLKLKVEVCMSLSLNVLVCFSNAQY